MPSRRRAFPVPVVSFQTVARRLDLTIEPAALVTADVLLARVDPRILIEREHALGLLFEGVLVLVRETDHLPVHLLVYSPIVLLEHGRVVDDPWLLIDVHILPLSRVDQPASFLLLDLLNRLHGRSHLPLLAKPGELPHSLIASRGFLGFLRRRRCLLGVALLDLAAASSPVGARGLVRLLRFVGLIGIVRVRLLQWRRFASAGAGRLVHLVLNEEVGAAVARPESLLLVCRRSLVLDRLRRSAQLRDRVLLVRRGAPALHRVIRIAEPTSIVRVVFVADSVQRLRQHFVSSTDAGQVALIRAAWREVRRGQHDGLQLGRRLVQRLHEVAGRLGEDAVAGRQQEGNLRAALGVAIVGICALRFYVCRRRILLKRGLPAALRLPARQVIRVRIGRRVGAVQITLRKSLLVQPPLLVKAIDDPFFVRRLAFHAVRQIQIPLLFHSENL